MVISLKPGLLLCLPFKKEKNNTSDQQMKFSAYSFYLYIDLQTQTRQNMNGNMTSMYASSSFSEPEEEIDKKEKF